MEEEYEFTAAFGLHAFDAIIWHHYHVSGLSDVGARAREHPTSA
jgi:hypothetical protein